MSEFNPQRARAKRPLPIWMDAFVRDTLHLDGDEVGAYFLMLGAMWTTPDCSLPNDPRKLARVCRCTEITFKRRIGPSILPLMSVEDGKVISWRLRKEACFTEHSVAKQHCRKTGNNPAKLLETLGWGLTVVGSAVVPRNHPTQLPNNLHKRREEKEIYKEKVSEFSSVFGGQKKKKPPAVKKIDKARGKLLEVASQDAVDAYLSYRKTTRAKGTTERAAGLIAKQLILISQQGGKPDEALDMAQLNGWQGLDASWYFNKKGQDNAERNSNNRSRSSNNRGMATGSKSAEIADRAARWAASRAPGR